MNLTEIPRPHRAAGNYFEQGVRVDNLVRHINQVGGTATVTPSHNALHGLYIRTLSDRVAFHGWRIVPPGSEQL
jgi:hypothetical protein